MTADSMSQGVLGQPDVEGRPPLAPIGRDGTAAHETGSPPLLLHERQQLDVGAEPGQGFGEAGLEVVPKYGTP